MIAKANFVIIIVALSLLCVNGICPAQENDTTVVLPYRRVNSGGPNDTTIKNAIHHFLANSNDYGSIPENPALSCKQIAELRPYYDSGYYWIQGVSGAVENSDILSDGNKQ